MKRKMITWLIVFCFAFTAQTNLFSEIVRAIEANTMKEATVLYAEGEDSITATKDWATVQLKLDVANLKAGEAMTLKMDKTIYNYSLTPFKIGNEIEVKPKKDGEWTLTALKDVANYSVNLDLKLRYTQNLATDLTDNVKFILTDAQGSSEKTVTIKVKRYMEKVKATELIRKVPLGFTENGKIAWVIYFNYNKAGLSGSKKTPFQFKDIVGAHQKLDVNSIAAYDVENPIIQKNGETIRNLEHGAYNYDASDFFQKQATEVGIQYSAADFKGIPTASSHLPNTNAYYIYLETTPEAGIPKDTLLTNYTYMSISYEGENAWEDEDTAVIVADESSGGTGQGSVILNKIDETTKANLKGAEFQLVNADTKKVLQKNLQTNSQGFLILSALTPAKY